MASSAIAPRRVSLALFALALALRIVYLAMASSPYDNYLWRLATSLLTDGSLSIDGVKTTGFEPMYPLFIAASRLLVGDRMLFVQMIQCGVAAIGAPLVYGLATSLTHRRRVGVIAGALYATCPLLVRYGGNIANDATLTAVLVLGFACLFVTAGTTARAAAAGVGLGLTILTRTMTLPLLPLGAALLWRDRGGRAGLAFVAATAVVVAPYALRNYALNGRALPTRGGMILFIANCEYTSRVMPDYGPDILQDYAMAALDRRAPQVGVPSPARERAVDEAFMGLVIERIAQDPLGTLAQKVRNVGYFFSPVLIPRRDPTANTVFRVDAQGRIAIDNGPPRPLVDRIVYTASYVPVFVFAVAGIGIRRAELGRDAVLAALVATFAVVQAIYVPTQRYRVPIEFVLLFYSAVAADRLLSLADASRSKKRGSDTNHPANAVFATVPSTAVTRCSMCGSMRNMIASPAPVFGASTGIPVDPRGRSWKTPPA